MKVIFNSVTEGSTDDELRVSPTDNNTFTFQTSGEGEVGPSVEIPMRDIDRLVQYLQFLSQSIPRI